MADMLKFFKGAVASLPASGVNGAIYITEDEGGIYLGTGTGMKRLGDFVQVASVSALPAKAHESCLYYCVAENILAKWNGAEWKQINKQPTSEELKTLLGLGTMAYKSEVAEADLNSELRAKVNAASEGNHSHANKALLDTYTQTEADLADAVAKKHEHTNKTELDKVAAGDVAKWNAVVTDHLTAADKDELADSISDVNTALGEEVTRAKAAEKANTDAIAAIKDGTNIDSFADVESALAGKQAAGDYATKAEAQAMADGKDAAIAEAKKAGTDAAAAAGTVASDLAAHITDANSKFETKTDASAKLTEAKGYTDTEVKKVQDEVDALETYVGTIPADEKYADVTNVIAYVNKKSEETLAAAQGGSSETAASVKQQLDNYKDENNTRVKAAEDAIDAIEADYLKAADKTELAEAIAAEETRATGIEAGLRTDVDAIKGDYLKTADKTALQEQITTNANAIERLTNGVSAEEVDGVNDLIQYVKDHGTEVTGMKEDIADNAAAITAEAEAARAAEGALSDRIGTLEAIDHDAYVAADTALKNELNAEIAKKADSTTVSAMDEAYKAADTALSGRIEKLEKNEAGYATTAQVATAKDEAIAAAKTETETQVKALADGQVATNKADIAALTDTLTWGSF